MFFNEISTWKFDLGNIFSLVSARGLFCQNISVEIILIFVYIEITTWNFASSLVFFFTRFPVYADEKRPQIKRRKWLFFNALWAKTQKKSNFKCVFGWLHKDKNQRFWKFFFTPGPLRYPPLEIFFSKNVDVSLWNKHT